MENGAGPAFQIVALNLSRSRPPDRAVRTCHAGSATRFGIVAGLGCVTVGAASGPRLVAIGPGSDAAGVAIAIPQPGRWPRGRGVAVTCKRSVTNACPAAIANMWRYALVI